MATTLHLQKKLKDQEVGIFDADDLLVRTLVGKKGTVKVSRKGAVGKAVENAVAGKKVRIMKV